MRSFACASLADTARSRSCDPTQQRAGSNVSGHNLQEEQKGRRGASSNQSMLRSAYKYLLLLETHLPQNAQTPSDFIQGCLFPLDHLISFIARLFSAFRLQAQAKDIHALLRIRAHHNVHHRQTATVMRFLSRVAADAKPTWPSFMESWCTVQFIN